MNLTDVQPYLQLASAANNLPKSPFWMFYDAEVDTLYINFHNPPQEADDSELTDDDVIIRYDADEEIIGLTILHASRRSLSQEAEDQHDLSAPIPISPIDELHGGGVLGDAPEQSQVEPMGGTGT